MPRHATPQHDITFYDSSIADGTDRPLADLGQYFGHDKLSYTYYCKGERTARVQWQSRQLPTH